MSRMPIEVVHYRKHAVEALVGKRRVGLAAAWTDCFGNFVIQDSFVAAGYRRRGVATAMYKSIESESGQLLMPAISLSDDAFEFWKSYRPSEVATDLRYWADQLIGARVVHRGDAGTILRACGGAATMLLDVPKPNGSETTIAIRYLNEALAAAGNPTLPLMADPTARRGVMRCQDEPVNEDSEEEMMCDVPDSSPVKLVEDIPNENWLNDKIEYALSQGRSANGVPCMSAITGYYAGHIEVATNILAGLKGQKAEQSTVRLGDLAAIKTIMETTGSLPLLPSGEPYAPYIEVAHNGEAWVSEGNHRIMAAAALGWEMLPVEIRYFDGGQRIESGPLFPEKIALRAPALMQISEPEETHTEMPHG